MGQRDIKPGALCANCVEAPATHHGRLERGGPLYQLCDACELPAREGHGIERGYEPTGGFLTAAEVRAAGKRAIGEERWERDTADFLEVQRAPLPARDPVDVALEQVAYETSRRIRTKANESNLRSRRERKLV